MRLLVKARSSWRILPMETAVDRKTEVGLKDILLFMADPSFLGYRMVYVSGIIPQMIIF